MTWDYKRYLNHPFFLLGAVGLVIIVAMYGLVPYGLGYGSEPASVLFNLWWMWQSTPEWEHCQLVPAIALGIIYWKSEESAGRTISFKSTDFIIFAVAAVGFIIACFEGWKVLSVLALLVLTMHVFLSNNRFVEFKSKNNLGALALLAFAMFFYWVGYKIDIVQISFLSLHFTLGALLYWFFGWHFMKWIIFPYVFLFFAWPMPFLDALAFKLRIVMSSFSYIFLNVIGIDAIRVGTAIVSAPNFADGIPQGAKFSLDVADPCSGIRSLFALTMVTALYSYFTQKTLWKQLLLFAFAVPLAVFGNFVRILMLTFGTILFGDDFAIGTLEHPSFYHMASGYVVFVVALGGMILVGWLLNDGWKFIAVLLGLKDKSFMKPVQVKRGSES